MTPVGFGLLSAVIGVVIFGSAIALGFPASTNFGSFAGFGDIREASVANPMADNSSETSGMAGPALLKGAISGGAADASGNHALAFGAAGAGSAQAAETGSATLKRLAAQSGEAGGRSHTTAKTTLAGPFVGAVAEGRAPSVAKTAQFEKSAPLELSDAGVSGDGEAVIFDYPIPPLQPSSEFGLGEDPLTSAAQAVPPGTMQPLDPDTGVMRAAFGAKRAAKANPEAAEPSRGPGLLNGSFVLSFNLTDDQLMLVFMVTGLLAVAIFLWLASSWLGDRATLKRQRLWEREQAEALAAVEGAEAGDGRRSEQVAA